MIKKKKSVSVALSCAIRNFRIRYRSGEPRSLPKKECVLRKEKKKLLEKYAISINQSTSFPWETRAIAHGIYLYYIYICR